MKKEPPNTKTRWFFLALVFMFLAGCQSAADHKRQVEDNSADKVTTGKVQKEIKVGMSGAEVATVLGSPNIVTTDEKRREVWIYDKIATTRAYSASRGGVSALFLDWSEAATLAGLSGSTSSSSGASSTSQQTLTVIIRFDGKGMVRDFSYHASRF